MHAFVRSIGIFVAVYPAVHGSMTSNSGPSPLPDSSLQSASAALTAFRNAINVVPEIPSYDGYCSLHCCALLIFLDTEGSFATFEPGSLRVSAFGVVFS